MNSKFNINRFVRDYRVDTAQPGSKHYRSGWVNVCCPFCRGDKDRHHLGFNEATGHWNCYRCGFHPQRKVVAALLRVSEEEAGKILANYADRMPADFNAAPAHTLAHSVTLPPHLPHLASSHRAYLENRGFDPDKLEAEWDLKATENIGPYKFRIIAPIYMNNRLVSYQGRDITDKSPLRYKACPSDQEVIPHKHTLYGIDKAQGHTVLVVEGITDVWRFGPGVVGTYGSQWKREQMLLLRRFSRRFIMFDPGEKDAQESARKLAAALGAFGGLNEVLELESDRDPGDLTDEEALHIRRELSL